MAEGCVANTAISPSIAVNLVTGIYRNSRNSIEYKNHLFIIIQKSNE